MSRWNPKVKTIDALERGDRQVSPEGLAPVWD